MDCFQAKSFLTHPTELPSGGAPGFLTFKGQEVSRLVGNAKRVTTTFLLLPTTPLLSPSLPFPSSPIRQQVLKIA